MDPLLLFGESNTEFPTIEERLAENENYLGINKPVPKNFYERIKNIEDRISHLESLSPEYKEFWVESD